MLGGASVQEQLVRVRLVCVTEQQRDPLLAEAKLYLERTGRRYQAGLVCVKPTKRNKGADDVKVRRDEGERLLAVTEGCHRIALDAGGRTFTSEALSAEVEKVIARGRPLALLIGGATGLSSEVLSGCEERWSLSSLTLPHRLAVLVAAEQLYRCYEIARGGPYHK